MRSSKIIFKTRLTPTGPNPKAKSHRSDTSSLDRLHCRQWSHPNPLQMESDKQMIQV